MYDRVENRLTSLAQIVDAVYQDQAGIDNYAGRSHYTQDGHHGKTADHAEAFHDEVSPDCAHESEWNHTHDNQRQAVGA